MQSILNNFISEVDDGNTGDQMSNAIDAPKKVTTKEPIVKFGSLVLTSCNDWDNQTKSNPGGLDEPHRVAFPSGVGNVQKCFSTSSSMHAFVLMEGGELRAMGRNDRGQLGTGDLDTAALPVPVTIPHPLKSPVEVVKVSTGRSHSLVLTKAGEVFGCGAHNFGQLGLGEHKATVNKNHVKFVPIAVAEDVYLSDIACGHDFSVFCDRAGCVWTCGHPEYGQLGHGSTGQLLQEGKKGIQYICEYKPRRVVKYVTKDAHNKTTFELHYSNVRIRAVAAGKNHVVCVEEWECAEDALSRGSNSVSRDAAYEPLNRVYTWGFGGYGRLGHNGSLDELYPREVLQFSHFAPPTREQIKPPSTQKQIRSVICGSTFSLAISASDHLYFWGKTSKAPRGEATVYPQMVQELYDYTVKQCAVGSNCIFVTASLKRPQFNKKAKSSSGGSGGSGSSEAAEEGEGSSTCCIAWGQSVGGKFGLEDGSKSTVHPKFVAALDGLDLIDVSCGYGHVSFVAAAAKQSALDALPVLHAAGGGRGKGAAVGVKRERDGKKSSGAAKAQRKK